MQTEQKGTVKGQWRVEKFDSARHYQDYLAGRAAPKSAVEFENCLLLTGLNELWRLATGASANVYSNANTQIGVGDSSTAAVNTQTDLLASTNKTYVAADATYPSTGAGGGVNNALVVKATFDGTHGNYQWNEMTIKNSASSICLNRAVQNLGTKAAGTVWTAQCTLTIT